MAMEKQWEDQTWTKSVYQKKPIWEEVGNHIGLLADVVCEAPDMQHLEGTPLYQAVARQVMLVIYSNLQHRFDPDSKRLKELTASQQSHWNFMLLGKLGDSTWDGTTEEAERIEQPVTRYFLCKLIHRLQLHGWDIDWQGIQGELEKGSRWRVLSSPASAEPRARWAQDYNNLMPSLDYPSPWSIANKYKVTVEHEEPVLVDRFLEDDKWREKKIWPCRVQNDGIFLVGPGNEIEREGGEITSTHLWVIEGLEPPTTFEEARAEQNTARLVDLLKQSMSRVTELERAVEELEAEVARNEATITGLTRTQRDLTLLLKQVRDLVDAPDRFKVIASKD